MAHIVAAVRQELKYYDFNSGITIKRTAMEEISPSRIKASVTRVFKDDGT